MRQIWNLTLTELRRFRGPLPVLSAIFLVCVPLLVRAARVIAATPNAAYQPRNTAKPTRCIAPGTAAPTPEIVAAPCATKRTSARPEIQPSERSDPPRHCRATPHTAASQGSDASRTGTRCARVHAEV